MFGGLVGPLPGSCVLPGGTVFQVPAQEVVTEYLAVATRFGELLPGAVHGYGLPHGRAARPGSAASVVRAAGVLADALDRADLDAGRARFLRSQLLAVEWTARRLAGQAVPYSAEVAVTCEVAVEMGPQELYREAHRALGELLPGSGALARRLREHRARAEVPREQLGPALRELAAVLRERTRALVELPAAEHVEFRVVDDAPWSALHSYRGGFRSEVTVNAGAQLRAAQLARLVAHEAYPGHHAERCRKEALLVARGRDEHRVVLACTPQALVAEGAADLAADLVAPGADVLAGIAAGEEAELAARVDTACAVLARVRQDAALLLHGRRVSDAAVVDHLRRWALVDEGRARQVLRFLRHPVWRTYTTASVEGGALVRRWWDRRPHPQRFRRLLDEPLTPAVLRAELADEPGQNRPNGAERSALPRRAVSVER